MASFEVPPELSCNCLLKVAVHPILLVLLPHVYVALLTVTVNVAALPSHTSTGPEVIETIGLG